MSSYPIVRAGRIAVCAFILAVAGCTSYYKVHDPSTGRTYYTNKVEHLDSGATQFTDARTGNKVSVQNSEIDKITKEEFETARAAPSKRPM